MIAIRFFKYLFNSRTQSLYLRKKLNPIAVFDAIQSSIQKLGRFSDEELLLFINKLTPHSLTKNTCLLHEGQVCQAAYFINKGSFRQYVVAADADEITSNLFVETDWVLDYQSFTSQKSAVSRIEANEDSEVLELTLHHLHALIAESGSFFRLGRLLEHALESQQYRTDRLSPEEKYRKLLASKPRIIQKFPLKHIASYLGVTPETLSRVRKKLTQSSDFLI